MKKFVCHSFNLPQLILRFLIMLILCWGFTLANASAIVYHSVIVADPGNTNDTTGFGAVSYIYQMGTYEVTIGQYTAFLNAVATTSDPYILWNQSMMAPNIQGISRSGTAGNYSYSVMAPASTTSGSSSENMPITGVTWFNAARFANWMANGQPIAPESDTTTENGAYALNGALSGVAVAKNTINPNTGSAPTYHIPTENEWYKAAFYDGAGSYYVYATQSNITPENTIGSDANLVNYLSDSTTGYCVSQSGALNTKITYLTNVGTFTGSSSHYGTFDQNGDAWEWNDLDGGTSLSRGLKGGAWTSTPPYLQSSYRLITIPSTYSVNVGFRLASPI